MTVAAVAWDIDGTLVDSEPLHLEALYAACAAFHVDIADLPGSAFVGVAVPDVWQALFPRMPQGATFAAFADAIDRYYAAHVDAVPVTPGARDVLASLAGAGIPQVAVSNSNRAVVDANLRLLGVGNRLAFSLSLDDVPAGKPHPAPYRMAAERLGLPAQAMLAVEDSTAGVSSAAAAGFRTVGLIGRDGPPKGADVTIRALIEVTALAYGGAIC